MRYASDQKDRTRKRIVDAAARTFRRDGIDRTGIVGLMGEIGLTQGGFYLHFPSKEALVEEAVLTAMEATRDRFATIAAHARSEGRDALGAILDDYLGPARIRRPDAGCPIATLGHELARRDAGTRRKLSRAADGIVAVIAETCPAGTPEARHQAAGAIYATMLGSLQLARLSPARDAAVRILADGRRAALALAAGDVSPRRAPSSSARSRG